MANSQERLKILEMLESGKINSAEALRLLEQLENGRYNLRPVQGWGFIGRFIFSFIPTILFLGILGGAFYGLIFHLPMYLTWEKIAVIFGGVIVVMFACIFCAIYAIRNVFKHRISVSTHGQKVVDVGFEDASGRKSPE